MAQWSDCQSLAMLDVPAWEPNSLAPFFVLINISISTQQKKTHKQQKARLEGETFNYCVPTHFTIWAAVVLRMGCQSDSARPANPEVCTFSEKQRALIISWRTLDNKFSIKMSLNGREQGCFEAFLPLVRLLVLSHGAAAFGEVAPLPLCLPWSSLWSHQKLTVPRFSCEFAL